MHTEDYSINIEEDIKLDSNEADPVLIDPRYDFSNYEFDNKKHPWYKDANVYKMIIMLILVVGFMIAELIVGIAAGSLALIADSFHMLSDGFGLAIGLFSLIIAKKGATPEYSYGFARAEILGGLVNSVFLLSVVLFIVLDAFERMIEPKPIGNAILVLSVGGGGLLVNIIGMIMFCGHAHHGHSHEHEHDHNHRHEEGLSHKHEHKQAHKEHDHDHKHEHDHDHSHKHHGKHGSYTSHSDEHDDASHHEKKHKNKHSHRNENMFGVFLHVFGDFLGSIGVMISATIVLVCRIYKEGSDKYTQYIDPAISVAIAILILFSTVPLLIRCAKVVLQGVPKSIKLPKLKKDLLNVENVTSVHDLHVWSLLGTQKIIGTVHLTLGWSSCKPKEVEYRMKTTSRRAKEVFHSHGVHSSTIQLEFPTHSAEVDMCNVMCSKDCVDEWCCPPDIKSTTQ